MKTFRFIITLAATMLAMAVPALAQAGGADNESTVNASKAIGNGLAVIGFGLAAGLAGIGQGLVGSRGAEGAARNPGASGTIQTLMIIGLALIESLVIFAFVVFLIRGI
jgi:F-type H+-transporting ATPase subunit c